LQESSAEWSSRRARDSTGAFSYATGAQEVPGPGDADGVGRGVFTTSGGGTTLNFTAMVQNIAAPTASHIHRGASTVAGPVVITLATSYPNDMASGSAAIPPAILEEILANPTNFYFNVHNADFPGGAVRGALQISPYAEIYYFPIVGRADGVNNTRFVSDLRAVNHGSSPASLTLEFFPSSPTGLRQRRWSKGSRWARGPKWSSTTW
jgi:hypothetical protein